MTRRRVRTSLIAVIGATVWVWFAVAAPTAQGAFPGKNGRIAYVNAGDIWTIDPDGSDAKRLTTDQQASYSPAWSPDGKKIAFSSARNGQAAIFVMDADGTDQRAVTSNPVTETSVANDGYPAWSPDGKKIAFEHQDGKRFNGYSQIFVVNIDGSGRMNLTNDAKRNDSHPAWSPDGARIAYVNGYGKPGVAVMDADGTRKKVLNPGTPAGAPSWSPDGKKLAFDSIATTPPSLWTIDADGSDATKIDSGGGREPGWSPDGLWITFESDRESVYQVYVMRADGSQEQRITDPEDGHDRKPDWQPVDPPPFQTPKPSSGPSSRPPAGNASEPVDSTAPTSSSLGGSTSPDVEGSATPGPSATTGDTASPRSSESALAGPGAPAQERSPASSSAWPVAGAIAGLLLVGGAGLVYVRRRTSA